MSRLKEIRLDLSVVMDKVATWLGIRSRVKLALGDCVTSDSEARDIFGRQYGFEAVIEGCYRI